MKQEGAGDMEAKVLRRVWPGVIRRGIEWKDGESGGVVGCGP